MKTLVTGLFCAACLSLGAARAVAQDNLLGIFADDRASVNQVESSGGQLNLYLVVLDPNNQGRSVSSIQGFEAGIEFAESGDFVMALNCPVPFINIGEVDNPIVGYSEPVPVTGSATVLATLVTYTAGKPESNIFLLPTASIPGYMALMDAEAPSDLVALEPASGDWGKPVFLVNSAGLNRITNWGSTKSMFR